MRTSTAGKWTGRIWLFAVFAFLYLPLIFLVVYSFSASEIIGDWKGFSLDWYKKLFSQGEIGSALLVSLKVAALSATGSIILGTLIAFITLRYSHFFGRKLFMSMSNAPLVMPEVIVGLSLLLMFRGLQNAFQVQAANGIIGIWIGHMLVGTAYAAVVIGARLSEINKQYEEAALDLGARPVQVFFLVTLPMITQTLAAAWFLAFTLSLDDVVIASILSGPGSTTLPVYIFSAAQRGLDPTLNALATIVIAVASIFVVLACYIMASRERRLLQQARKK